MNEDKKPNIGVVVKVPNIEVKGMITIKDKYGNVKNELDIVSLESNEDLDNAIKRDT